MRKLLLTAALLGALAAPAYADVILDTNGLGGTGTNVVFNSFNGPLSLVLGTLNGQHNEVVRFRDLSGNANFAGTAGANGNDIKIFNTSDLDVTIFDSLNTTQIGVTREVFSLKGTGTVLFHVTMLETDGTFLNRNFGGFDLGNGSQQNGFDFQAINGERIWDLDIVTLGTGVINDFEHYRIDVVPTAVPGPIVGAGIPGIIAAAGMMLGLARNRRRRQDPAQA
jgi:hypothetical protein